MSNTQDNYKTPFERILEFGIHAYNFPLGEVRGDEGAILLDEYVPVLISNTDYNKGQFRILHDRKGKKGNSMLSHLLLVQGKPEKIVSIENLAQRGELYEVLSFWQELTSPLPLPNFELTAHVSSWYIDSLQLSEGKQPYDCKKMTGRTLDAIRNKLILPRKEIPLDEID